MIKTLALLVILTATGCAPRSVWLVNTYEHGEVLAYDGWEEQWYRKRKTTDISVGIYANWDDCEVSISVSPYTEGASLTIGVPLWRE